MLETSARLMKLLSLLQTHRHWSGAELAERLGVTVRTVRRDIDRLRELGYPVDAVQGTAGYRLGAGVALPPLLLDDDEAVAVAIGLRTATASSVTGIEETALRALTKLEQVLPSRLRHRVRALQQATVRVATPGPAIDQDVLMAISDACQRHERLRFDYTSHDGSRSRRDVEPNTLVNWRRHWYLVAWDVDRSDGAPPGSTACCPEPRLDRASHYANHPMVTRRLTSPGNSRPGLGRYGQRSPCTNRPTLLPRSSGPAWARLRRSTPTIAGCTWAGSRTLSWPGWSR